MEPENRENLWEKNPMDNKALRELGMRVMDLNVQLSKVRGTLVKIEEQVADVKDRIEYPLDPRDILAGLLWDFRNDCMGHPMSILERSREIYEWADRVLCVLAAGEKK